MYPLFHPYASIIWIRLEGIISACTRRHPLKSAAKVVQIERKTKENRIFFWFFRDAAYLRGIASEVKQKFDLAKEKCIYFHDFA